MFRWPHMSPTLPPPTLSAGLVTPPVPVVVLCRERAVTNMASDLFIVKMPDVRSCITFGSSCCRWAYGVKPTCALFRWIDPPHHQNKKQKKQKRRRNQGAKRARAQEGLWRELRRQRGAWRPQQFRAEDHAHGGTKGSDPAPEIRHGLLPPVHQIRHARDDGLGSRERPAPQPCATVY